MRGFFGGLIIGLITVAIVVVALSLLSPASQSPAVTDGAPQSATGATGAGPEAGAEDVTSGADADLAELPPSAPGMRQGQPDDLAPLDEADTRPADKPRVGGATAGLEDPATAPKAPEIDMASDAPVTPPAPADAPGLPESDSRPAAVADPVQPAVPEVPATGSGFAAPPAAPESPPQVAAGTDTAPAGAEAGPPTRQPEGESAPAPSTAPATPPQGDVAATPQPDTPDEENTRVAAMPRGNGTAETGGSRFDRKVVPLTERKKPDTAAEAEAEEVQVAVAPGPAIETYAIPFENPDNRPMMAIVLIDDDAGLGAEALAEFPYPLTFAVDPSAPDAAEKMARYRAAGFEVVAMIDLPPGATAQDAETSLSVWLDKLPEVVALLEGTDTGFQGNRDLSDQVTAIAGSTGLGLVMQAKGLNTAQKLALRDGVPAGIVFRDFDGVGQSIPVMRRFLDQAAFRAGQQGGVIMLGRLRPDTISALLLWGLQDRASRLALAPISAVLRGQLGER